MNNYFFAQILKFFIGHHPFCLVCFRAEYLEIGKWVIPTPWVWHDMIIFIGLWLIEFEWSTCERAWELISILFINVFVVECHSTLKGVCFCGNCFWYLPWCGIEIPDGQGSFASFWILKGIDFILYSFIMYWHVCITLLCKHTSSFT